MKQEVNEIQNRTKAVLGNNAVRPDFYLDDAQLDQLRQFCDELNPYIEMNLEEKLRLSEYGIHDLANPFEITNKLLLLMENNLQYREKL